MRRWVILALLGLTVLGLVVLKVQWDAWTWRDLQGQVTRARQAAIEEAREAVKGKQTDLMRQEARLKAALEETRRLADGLKAQLETANRDLARQRVERERLVASGSLEAVLEAGKALGYAPKAAPRSCAQ